MVSARKLLHYAGMPMILVTRLIIVSIHVNTPKTEWKSE